MNQSKFIFQTGDVYLEERISIPCILEKVQDPAAEWNNIGVWIDDGDFQGVITVKDGALMLIPYRDLINDPTVLRAAVRRLNYKFGRSERYQIKDYYKRMYYTDAQRLAVGVLSRVFQRMGPSAHPKIKSPTYIVNGDGSILDHRGNTLQPYRTNRVDKELTLFEIVSSLLSQAKVFGLKYNPEMNISDFNEGDFMDQYLERPEDLKQEPFRNGARSMGINKEMKQLLVAKGSKEGASLLNLYFENYFFLLDDVEEEQVDQIEVESVNMARKQKRADPNIAKEKAKLMQSDQNLKRAIRDREIEERTKPRGISYK